MVKAFSSDDLMHPREPEEEEEDMENPSLWEEYNGDEDSVTTYRCPVPGGWLVMNNESYTITFLPDPQHQWRWPPPI